jgi:hypothetical protein
MMAVESPVVFIIFKRPNTTKEVFDAISRAKPKKLLIVADGPRHSDEAEKCRQARAIAEQVTWDCEVLKNYSETNMGCMRRIISGLDWAFSQVEEAIILEDDCVPAPSFFHFCQTLLEYYRNDERIMMISGCNFQFGRKRTDYSYYFSKHIFITGWATWRRAWRHCDVDMKAWPEFKREGFMRSLCEDPYEQKNVTQIFDAAYEGRCPTAWCPYWAFACWSQNGLSINPNSNLISNIGDGPDGTNCLEEGPLSRMPTTDIWEIKHPPFVARHRDADDYAFNEILGGRAMKEADTFRGKMRRYLSAIKRRFIRLWSKFPGVKMLG